MSQHKPEITEGTPVRVLKWDGQYTGTVVRRDGDTVFVAYHDSCVEDDMGIADVEALADPTPEESAWRGGFGIMSADGGWDIVPVHQEG